MKIHDEVKSICITVSGSVRVSSLALRIIDSKWFQRLRYMRQMSVAYLVFPCATETRFEHSIGTYGLAGDLLDSIKKNSRKHDLNTALLKIPELKTYLSTKTGDDLLDDHICELIKIAALCHDIGHGPFSHTYDDYLHRANRTAADHEERSQMIVERLLKGVVSDDEIRFVQILIDPPKEREGFVYQIVCNKKNSIDVDKLDYVNRDSRAIGKSFRFDTTPLIQQAVVIDDDLCYPERMAYEITGLFALRYMLFKQVCANKTIIAVQYMMFELFELLEDELQLRAKDLDRFCLLTDDYVRCFPRITEKETEEIQKAKQLLDRIEGRRIYKNVVHRIFESGEDADRFADEMRKTFPGHKFIVHRGKIGLVPNGIDDLFGSILFYRNKQPDKKFTLNREQISSVLPVSCFEHYVMVFSLNL